MDSAKKDQSTETSTNNRFLWCPCETCFMSVDCIRHGRCSVYQEWLARRNWKRRTE